MCAQLSRKTLALTTISVLLAVGPAAWAADYYSTTNPGTTAPPSLPWVQVVGGALTFSFEPGGGNIWFATNNLYWATHFKAYNLVLYGPTTSLLEVGGAWGYYNGGSSESGTSCVAEHPADPPARLQCRCTFWPQPDWEVVKVTSTQGGTHVVSVLSRTYCMQIQAIGSTWDNDGWFGPPGASFRYPVVMVFPTDVQVNTSITPTFVAPPYTGTWQYSFEYQDPYGQPMPYGGVRWSTAGPGLTEQVQFQSSFAVLGSAETPCWCYAYNADEGQWDSFWIEPPPPPIPATSEWGLAALAAGLIVGGAVLVVRRERTRARATQAA